MSETTVAQEERQTIGVVVLAGGPVKGDLTQVSNADHKALVSVAGRTLLEHTLRALNGCPNLRPLIVVGPPEAQTVLDAVAPQATLVECGDSLVENLVRGFRAAPEAGRLLTTSSDLPLLRASELSAFVEEGLAHDVDLVYSMAPREPMDAAFPGTQRTYVTVREGTYTGGNVMLLSRRLVRGQEKLIRDVFALRKKPLKLCGLLGWRFVLKLLFHRATVAELVQRAEHVAQCTATVVEVGPTLAFDVDKQADLRLAERLLAETPGAAA